MTYICAVLFGMGILPILSISSQFGCEISFPISPSSVAGFLFSFSQTFAIIMSLIITLILPN